MNRYRSTLVFGRWPIEVLKGVSTLRVFCFRPFLKAKFRTVPQIDHDRFLPNSSNSLLINVAKIRFSVLLC